MQQYNMWCYIISLIQFLGSILQGTFFIQRWQRRNIKCEQLLRSIQNGCAMSRSQIFIDEILNFLFVLHFFLTQHQVSNIDKNCLFLRGRHISNLLIFLNFFLFTLKTRQIQKSNDLEKQPPRKVVRSVGNDTRKQQETPCELKTINMSCLRVNLQSVPRTFCVCMQMYQIVPHYIDFVHVPIILVHFWRNKFKQTCIQKNLRCVLSVITCIQTSSLHFHLIELSQLNGLKIKVIEVLGIYFFFLQNQLVNIKKLQKSCELCCGFSCFSFSDKNYISSVLFVNNSDSVFSFQLDADIFVFGVG
eukprot:TRINITY_DN2374_c0_g1_i1.p2 TRINITY_DN2374_c0_g1~~TRINITY_DN2374_c0_g1_i1.p2  ORF type:complete len:303 (-),score=-6.51 TRINITY_DN2374_c0_g1_i1:92-1000(-)